MKKQKYGFELIFNDTDTKIFKTKSASYIPNDELTISLEYDKEYQDLLMEFWVKTTPSGYLNTYSGNWFTNLYQRIKLAGMMLFNKRFEYDYTFMFRGRNHIEDFCDMLYLLSKDVKKETTELTDLKKEYLKLKK